MSWIPCPSCGQELPPQPLHCPHCALPLTGPVAARLWAVDQQLATLQTERTGLLAALRARTAAARTTTGASVGVQAELPGAPSVAPSAAASQSFPDAASPRPPRRSWTTQQTLLAVGVLLVLTASSLALAIAWFVIGPYGQVVVMGGFTALAAYAGLYLSRRGLPSSAEALAVVSGGLMLLDTLAARRMDLFGLQQFDGRWYTVVTGLLVALLLAWLHQRDVRVAAFALLSLTAASIGWGGLVTLSGSLSDSAATLAAMAGAVAFGLLHLRLPRATGVVRRAATGPAAGWTTMALALGAWGAFGAYDPFVGPGVRADGLLCVLALLALAAAGIDVVRRVVTVRTARLGSRAAVKHAWIQEALTGDWRALGVVVTVATVAPPVAVSALALQLGALGTAVLATTVGAATIAVLWLRPWGRGWTGAWAEAQGAAGVLVLIWVSLVHGSRPALVTTLSTAALVATSAAVQRPRWRRPASAAAATSFAAAAAVAAAMVSPTAQALTLAAVGVLLMTVALLRRAQPEELVVGTVAALTAVYAVAVAVAQDLPMAVLIASLAAITAEAAAVAVLRVPGRAVAAGVSAATAAEVLWLVGDLLTREVQLALVALAAAGFVGLAVWRRGRREEATLAAVGLVVAAFAVLVAQERGWTHAASGLAAAYGLIGVGYAALPGRRPAVTVGVVALSAATWMELGAVDVGVLEAYTVPPAVLLLAAGLWSRHELRDHSWLTMGPGLVVGMLPSAIFTAVSDPLPRVALTLVAGAAALAVGAWRRRQALVVVGAAAATTVGVTQLGPIALQLDKSVVIGVVGVGLLAIGARYEQRRADARAAVSWLASMS